MLKKFLMVGVAAGSLTFAACGAATDHGGYASGAEGCAALGAKVERGPIREPDEVEFLCSNGQFIEAAREHVTGPDAKMHKNAWLIDEDTRLCADGTEVTVGDEAATDYNGEVAGCKNHDGPFGG